ncbi:MAG: hypothetical protein IJE07_14325 [Clostridia bacterium]|nr:hypothetical protein [Clostridia bacterium]
MNGHPNSSGLTPLQKRLQALVCSRIGDDFLADMAFLAHVTGYRLSNVATILQAGRHVELASAFGKLIGVPDLLAEQAQAYVLPEKYRRDPKLLLHRLYWYSR